MSRLQFDIPAGALTAALSPCLEKALTERLLPCRGIQFAESPSVCNLLLSVREERKKEAEMLA